MLAFHDRQAFVDALGGEDAPAGSTGLTVGELADRLQSAVTKLTSPGYRVYPPVLNRLRFWEEVSGS